ncbi:MAG: hypothetical protein WC538_20220 [Thermoanaerobaculia bacterium]
MIAFWKQRRAWILAIGALLVLNTLFFLTYRVRYEERVDDARARLGQAKEQLAVAKARRVDYEQQLAAHKAMVETINTVYETWWSTPEKRLTTLITETRKLVEKCGLTVENVSYSRGDVSGDGGTTTMDITFSVQGTYLQLRQLINLLELSDEFIIIDSVAFNGDDPSGTIGLNLRLRTIFKGEVKQTRVKRVAK